MHGRTTHKEMSRYYKEVPLDHCQSYSGIFKYLKEAVKGQETTLNKMAVQLLCLLECEEGKVFPLTLAGVDGSGKRTTIERIKRLFGMERNQRYEKQFVEVSGASVSAERERDACRQEILSIIKRLNKAKKTQTCPDTGREQRLPYICLVISNVDKASMMFIDNVVCPLLEDGYCRMDSTNSFRLPERTPLLLICTTDCVSAEIAAMTEPDDAIAEDIISRALRQRWPGSNLSDCLIYIMPYYPLDEIALRPLLITKFEEYMKTAKIQGKFGSHSLQCDDEVKSLFVDHVLARMNTTKYGVKVSIGQLITRLNIFFKAGLDAIKPLVTNGGRYHSKPIVVTARSIDIERFAQSLDENLKRVDDLKQSDFRNPLPTYEVVNSILSNPENNQLMKTMHTHQAGTVKAVTMACGDKPLCSVVANIHYTNVTIINNHNKDQREQVHQLKKKLHAYKHSLKEVIDTIDRSSTEETFAASVKQIADDKRSLIESSSSSGSCSSVDDDEDDNDRPRKGKKRLRTLRAAHPNQESAIAKRVRLSQNGNMEEEELLEYSDEVEIYLTNPTIFKTPVQQNLLELEEDEEAAEQAYAEEMKQQIEKERHDNPPLTPKGMNNKLSVCPRCQKMKPLPSFTKKHKGKDGKILSTYTKKCNSCRTGRG